MKTVPLGLEHREILSGRLRSLELEISEYCFANLYLFRREHEYAIGEGSDLFVYGKTRDGENYVMPTGDVRLMPAENLRTAVKNGGMMFPVPHDWLSAFDTSEYAVSSSDGDSDYIHHIAKLETYSGNKLHAKKNLMNQFVQKYSSQALALTLDRLGHAREILESWQLQSAATQGETDYRACREAIDLYEELVLCGGIYYADGAPAGFVIGEELNNTTFALHFSKARREFAGVYQYMFSHFATVMPSKYSSFNFEQDLGMESLRRSKASYRPEKMVQKYRITLK